MMITALAVLIALGFFVGGLTVGIIIGVKAGIRKAIDMTEEAFPDLKTKGRL